MKFNTNTGGGGGGFLQDKPLIVGVAVRYNEVNTSLMKPFDVQIDVQFERPANQNFDPTVTYEGNFERSATNEVIGDKDFYKIKALLAAVGVVDYEVDANGRFMSGFLEQALVGKRISIVKYIYDAKEVNGEWKPRWKNWWKVAHVDKAGEQLAEFTKKIGLPEGAKGRIKDFKPNAVELKKGGAERTATREGNL